MGSHFIKTLHTNVTKVSKRHPDPRSVGDTIDRIIVLVWSTEEKK